MDVEALLKSGDINSIRAYAVDLNNKGVATEDKELKRKLFSEALSCMLKGANLLNSSDNLDAVRYINDLIKMYKNSNGYVKWSEDSKFKFLHIQTVVLYKFSSDTFDFKKYEKDIEDYINKLYTKLVDKETVSFNKDTIMTFMKAFFYSNVGYEWTKESAAYIYSYFNDDVELKNKYKDIRSFLQEKVTNKYGEDITLTGIDAIEIEYKNKDNSTYVYGMCPNRSYPVGAHYINFDSFEKTCRFCEVFDDYLRSDAAKIETFDYLLVHYD